MKTISVGVPFAFDCKDQDGDVVKLDGSDGAIDHVTLVTRDAGGNVKEHAMTIMDASAGLVGYTFLEGDVESAGLLEMEVIIYYEDGRVIPQENRVTEYIRGSLLDEEIEVVP